MAKKRFISDQEMAQMSEPSSSEGSKKRFISDEEMSQMAAPEEKSLEQQEDPGLLAKLGGAAMEGLGTVGEYYDRYTGAPVRRGMLSLQAGRSIPEAAEAAYEQFGEPTKYAPTGKELFEIAGASKKPLSEYIPSAFSEKGSIDILNPEKSTFRKGGLLDASPAGVLGLGFEMGADPLMLAGKGIKAGKGLIGGDRAAKAAQAVDVATPPPPASLSQAAKATPKSLDELKNFTSADDFAKNAELPTADRLRQIEQVLPDMQHKPLGIHKEMLSSKQNFDEMRTALREVPGPERQAVDAYELGMKREIQEKLAKEADAISDGLKFDSNVQAGENLVKDIKGAYDTSKKEAGAIFNRIDRVPMGKTQHIPQLINRLATENPRLAGLLEVTEDGLLTMKKVSPKTGLSKQEASLIGELVDDINSGSMSFKDMQNVREYLRKSIDPTNPKAFETINGIRKSMLSHMEDMAQIKSPNLDVRGAFTQWAKNEKYIDDMSDLLNSDLRSSDALKQTSPERLIDRMFSDVNSARFAKEKLAPMQFKAMSGQYLRNILDQGFDTAKNQASMAKIAQKVKRAKPVLLEAFGPEVTTRIEALVDLGRIIPDAASVNPSGTTKSGLIAAGLSGAKKAANFQFGEAAGDVAKAIDNATSKRRAKIILNQALSGIEPAKKQGFLKSIGKSALKHKGLIRDASKAANISTRSEEE